MGTLHCSGGRPTKLIKAHFKALAPAARNYLDYSGHIRPISIRTLGQSAAADALACHRTLWALDVFKCE